MRKNFIDNMVPEFGYDYVIGFCMCSSYDLRNKAKRTDDPGKAAGFLKTADMYARKAEALTRERIESGL